MIERLRLLCIWIHMKCWFFAPACKFYLIMETQKIALRSVCGSIWKLATRCKTWYKTSSEDHWGDTIVRGHNSPKHAHLGWARNTGSDAGKVPPNRWDVQLTPFPLWGAGWGLDSYKWAEFRGKHITSTRRWLDAMVQ